MNCQPSSEQMREIVARALRHWRIEGKDEPTASESSDLGLPSPALTIAISRQSGANGSRIARLVGQRLSWPVYDRELLERLADEMGLRTDLGETLDEQRPSWLEECLEDFRARPRNSSMDGLPALPSLPEVIEDAPVRHLLRVLFALAADGLCVIVGRGAAQVLPAATTLRVRVVAPLAKRVARMQERFALLPDAAEERVRQIDADRNHLVRQYFHKNPDDPALYDLILNSGQLDTEECAELILTALAERIKPIVEPSAAALAAV
jgi:cytidylate kinase